MSKNLIIRTSVAAVAIPVILYICYHGGMLLFGMVALFAAVAACELLYNEAIRPSQVSFWLSLGALAGCMTVTSIIIPVNPADAAITAGNVPFFLWLSPILVAYFLVSSMITAAGRRSPKELFTEHARLFWGTAYLGMLYPFVYAVGNDRALDALIGPSSRGDLLLFLFGLLWVGDTCAMGFGKWIGKHKLAPGVSPNKTVEGFVGGIIGAVAIGVLMYYWKFHQVPFVHIMAISIGCSIFGQLGDLVESMWKRSLGIKDSSNIIPGHGGVLDRFDSLLFAAPFMYGYLMLLS
jgi:phosphatidate cytidylyltransferase